MTRRHARLVARDERTLYPGRRTQVRERLQEEFGTRLPNLPVMFAPERVLARETLRDWQTPADVSFGSAFDDIWFDE